MAERAVWTVVALVVHGFVQVIVALGVFGFGNLLRLVARFAKVRVEQAGDEFLADDRLHGGTAYPNFSTTMMRGPVDGARGNFRCVYGRHRLRLVIQSALHPS